MPKLTLTPRHMLPPYIFIVFSDQPEVDSSESAANDKEADCNSSVVDSR